MSENDPSGNTEASSGAANESTGSGIEPGLGAEEREALREAMEPRPRNQVTPLDLRSSERSSRRLFANLNPTAPLLTERLVSLLGRHARMTNIANQLDLAIVGPSAAAEALTKSSLCYRLIDQRGRVGAIIALHATLALVLVDRIFGGTATRTGPQRTRLTDIERGALAPVLHDIASVSAATFLGAELKHVMVDGPYDTQEIPSGEDTVMLWQLILGEQGSLGCVNIAVFSTLAALIDRHAAPLSADQVEASSLRSNIQRAAVDVHAQLGTAQVSLAELLALRPGDVLRLNRSEVDPLPVYVGNTLRFWGKPLQRHGVFGIEVTGEAT